VGFINKVLTTIRSVANHPLNRNAKWAGAIRFCMANAAVRFLARDVRIKFPNGTRLMISPRMKGAAHFINPGLCEFDEMGFVLHFLQPPDVFIDVGANVGAYTVLASGVKGARTIAFEPNPSTYSYLERNILENGLTERACAINAALGDSPGDILLTDKLGTENYVIRGDEKLATVRVRVDTLDRALGDHRPTMIKVDVEGFETKVFAGANAALHCETLLAMIVERSGIGSRYGFDEAPLHKSIQGAGFTPCRYSPLERALRRVDPEATGNIIYVRDFPATQTRLREARPFEFAGHRI
jgi:FkbM family methyltransferase